MASSCSILQVFHAIHSAADHWGRNELKMAFCLFVLYWIPQHLSGCLFFFFHCQTCGTVRALVHLRCSWRTDAAYFTRDGVRLGDQSRWCKSSRTAQRQLPDSFAGYEFHVVSGVDGSGRGGDVMNARFVEANIRGF